MGQALATDTWTCLTQCRVELYEAPISSISQPGKNTLDLSTTLRYISHSSLCTWWGFFCPIIQTISADADQELLIPAFSWMLYHWSPPFGPSSFQPTSCLLIQPRVHQLLFQEAFSVSASMHIYFDFKISTEVSILAPGLFFQREMKVRALNFNYHLLHNTNIHLTKIRQHNVSGA